MKQFIMLFCITLVCMSCKNDVKTNTSEETSTTKVEQTETPSVLTLQGNFIYSEDDDVAVLQTQKSIYGVIVDSMMHKLNKQVTAYKTEPTDMIPVVIKAKLSDKTDKTEWKDKLEIQQIIKVNKPKPEDNQVIKLN